MEGKAEVEIGKLKFKIAIGRRCVCVCMGGGGGQVNQETGGYLSISRNGCHGYSGPFLRFSSSGGGVGSLGTLATAEEEATHFGSEHHVHHQVAETLRRVTKPLSHTHTHTHTHSHTHTHTHTHVSDHSFRCPDHNPPRPLCRHSRCPHHRPPLSR